MRPRRQAARRRRPDRDLPGACRGPGVARGVARFTRWAAPRTTSLVALVVSSVACAAPLLVVRAAIMAPLAKPLANPWVRAIVASRARTPAAIAVSVTVLGSGSGLEGLRRFAMAISFAFVDSATCVPA